MTPNDLVERTATVTVPRPDAAHDAPRAAPTYCYLAFCFNTRGLLSGADHNSIRHVSVPALRPARNSARPRTGPGLTLIRGHAGTYSALPPRTSFPDGTSIENSTTWYGASRSAAGAVSAVATATRIGPVSRVCSTAMFGATHTLAENSSAEICSGMSGWSCSSIR